MTLDALQEKTLADMRQLFTDINGPGMGTVIQAHQLGSLLSVIETRENDLVALTAENDRLQKNAKRRAKPKKGEEPEPEEAPTESWTEPLAEVLPVIVSMFESSPELWGQTFNDALQAYAESNPAMKGEVPPEWSAAIEKSLTGGA